MMEVLRYALFAVEVYLMGRLFWRIAVTRILAPQQYEQQPAQAQTFASQPELALRSREQRAS